MLKYVVPVYLLAIFVGFCLNNLPGYAKSIANDRVAVLSLLFIGGVLAFLMLLIRIAGKRWEKEGRLPHLGEQER